MFAVYKIEINPEDLAGNSAEPRCTVVFEIDKTADENDTAFVDVYPYSRKDDPAPTVEFSDSIRAKKLKPSLNR